MSVELKLGAEQRTDAGKGASRRLRQHKKVPAIVYGADKEPEPIQVSVFELTKLMESETFFSQIITLDVGGRREQTVLKDLQRHPFKDLVVHMDFMRIKSDEKLTSKVPMHFLNEEECKGVKNGGVVHKDMIEVGISCLPRDLPEYLEVDLTDVDVGESVHLSEVSVPDGVELEAFAHGGDMHDHDQAVASIVQSRATKKGGGDSGAGEAGDEEDGDEDLE